MFRHVVCHKYVNKAEAEKIAPMLRSLMEKVPTLRNIQVGVDLLDTKRSYHLVLTADFDDITGLEEYKAHPEHVKVREYIHSVMESSVSVDYEC